MKNIFCVIIAILSFSASASVEKKAANVDLSSGHCSWSMNGNAIQHLVDFQSDQVYFHINYGNGDATPVFYLTPSKDEWAHLKTKWSAECPLLKACLEEMASYELSVSAKCINGVLEAKLQ